MKLQFFDRLRAVFVPSHFIEFLDSKTTYHSPPTFGISKRKDKKNVFRVIFEYHPLWAHVFQRFVREFHSNGFNKSLLAAAFNDEVRWELQAVWSLKASRRFGAALIEW